MVTNSDNWKILRDPFYGPLYQQFGTSYIEEAGFFFDTSTKNIRVEDSLNILCTPLEHLLPPASKPCILLSTGSFCPIHEGHLQMMEKAKEAAERAGHQVMGGYLSPGHDEYIRGKTGDEWIPIHNRIEIIRRALKKHPWMGVDPWEGVFNQVAVNFTDVIFRLNLYISKHLGQKIPIFYVCGGDNARFIKTFKNEGYCIVVNRPQYQGKYLKYLTNNPDHQRILFIDADNNLSSTQLRREKKFTPSTKKNLQLRLSKNNPLEQTVFQKLTPYFESITPYYVEDQKQLFQEMTQGHQSISMDSLISGDYNLQISRQYDLFGINLLRYTHRPLSPTLEEQISSIPRGDYLLFDDDIHTGNTIRFARNELEKQGLVIKSIRSLNVSNSTHDEILDARDFLFGFQENAGLVIKLPNQQQVRVPYLYPYVCPFIRASINEPLKFSIEMWRWNAELHQKNDLKLNDVPFLYTLGFYLGFDPQTSLYDICQWHIEMLSALVKKPPHGK